MFKNLLNKVGWGELPSSFAYVIGDKVDLPYQCVWQLHKGQKRSDGSPVSLFVGIKKDLDTVQVAAAKNAQQLAKSLRHPNIIQVLDSCETDTGIYLATEPVISLLSPEAPEDEEGNPMVWGLYQALDALGFLHNSGFVHGLFGPTSIFLSPKGDYRLAGFELCKKGADASDLLAGWRRCGPKIMGWPEPPSSLAEGGSPTSAVDLWGAAVLAAFVFGSARPMRGRGVECRPDFAKLSQDAPPELQKSLAELQKPGPLRGRNPIAELIALQYFQQHPAVHMMSFLNSLHIRSSEEKEAFFEAMPTLMDRVPQSQQKRQVLPDLLTAQKFPGQEAAQVLPSILKIGSKLNEEEFKEKVAPLVVQLFVSPDRAIRFRLLMSIGDMIGNLDDVMINDKIFPECVNGFTDSSGPIREATVKALIHFVPRLKVKTVEGRVSKLLLKLLQDPEASIRTNAVICCGRISGHIPKACAAQTLMQALQAGMKDSFGPCRSASLHTLLATCALFSMEELANRLLPLVCLRLVDPDPTVSDTAFEVLSGLQKHLRTQVDERRAAQQLEPSSGQAPEAAGGSAAKGTWGSWALSTVGSVMSQKIMGSMSSKPSAGDITTASSSGAVDAMSSPAPSPEKPPTSSGAGMSLGNTSKPRSSTGASSLNLDDSNAPSGAWEEDDNFWDDFDDSAPTASVSEPTSKKAAPATSIGAMPKAKGATAKKAPAAKASNDEDDFWKEFDM
mmetsp:Transcript_50850/g.80602  ORF Transcript_50850/g.80602 Transcript_50850/m.80602 type:complete len:729 (-) Transcript_50850:193-2379(-)|eukprot:CAMPEP_0169114040 /NCGR_PEP_ID=MMETSP1015-20121227/28531_1 /TAXON_ID=342587 /ORGANISM="Karlodinium micrum, Strain CCMP2283" /LENGTH=728 /DNA_ID=CAMNT_0009176267 /DNA_START=107 /DNA_END=2293 /DNA_ORIENTATION=-